MKKYNKDYKLITKLLPSGKVRHEVEYIDKYYVSRLSKKELLKGKVYCLTLTLCSGITMIGIGLINTSVSRVAYVALPYVILFFPTAFCLMGAVRFAAVGNKLEHVSYDRSINRIQKSAIGQIILSGIAAAGDIIYLFLIKSLEKPLFEAVFLIGIIIVLLLSILIFKKIRKSGYEAEDSEKSGT